MPCYAVVIKKANKDRMVIFKYARSYDYIHAAIVEKLKGTTHKLGAITIVGPDVHIPGFSPRKKKHKNY